MHFYLIGIDHKNAPIEVRERAYRARRAIAAFWASLSKGPTLLVTCNRFEIYGAEECADESFGRIHRFMTDFPEFARYAYLKKGEQEVSAHALRLAVGLESQLKGERQICVQLARWAREITSKPLGDIWVKALSSAQKIRAISGLGEDDVNIANLVLNDIKKRLGCKNNYKIIIIGTGKIAELFAQYSSREIYLDFAAHKNYSKATKLAGYSNGKALLFDDLPGAIAGADALISATLSPHYIITRDRLSSWISGRSHPIYVYDLAVPRDVDPRVSGLEGVLLPDIRDILDRHNLSVEKKVLSATAMIEGALINHGEIVYEKTA